MKRLFPRWFRKTEFAENDRDESRDGRMATLSASQVEMLQWLTMPNGIRCSVLATKMNWKRASIRAAISRLRAIGFAIETIASSKHGETIYCYRHALPKQYEIDDAAGNGGKK